tara:strand:- start:378 stop:809 length:432 start_codon:yes stop_codon:yes gene_type:complete
MIKIFKLKLILFLTLILSIEKSFSENSYFEEGKSFFTKKDYEMAKFKFEKDIVFNPKNESSYLYLAKIYKKENKTDLMESNLKTVVLLNPTNEEATYELALLSLKQSNFEETKKLIKKFNIICKKICEKEKNLKSKLGDSLKK